MPESLIAASELTQRRLRRWTPTALLIALASVVAYLTSFHLRFAGNLTPATWQVFAQTVLIVVIVRIGVTIWLGQRQVWSRYFSFHDLLGLVQSVSIGTIGVTLATAMLVPEVTIPRSVILLDWGTTLFALAAIHSVPRIIHDAGLNLFSKKDRITALIVGANDAGESLLRAIQRSPSLHYEPVGFVDDRSSLAGRRIAGVPVLGGLDDLPAIVQKRSIEQVLITADQLPGKQVRELLDLADERRFSVRVLPSYEQLLREDVSIKPRDVAITDLLRRPPVELNTARIRQWLRGRVVMVTGSAGSIGSEIAKQVLEMGPAKVILLDRSETGQFFLERELSTVCPEVEREVVMADATDLDRLRVVFDQCKPDVIFHAAAYKHVPLMERHPGEAVKNIVVATRNLVDLAEEHGAQGFVMISTDKAVNPTSVMGSCKRVAEQYVQAKAASSACRLVTVRFGNVLDSAGSVVPIFREQIAAGGPVTVTHADMVRFFMLIPEAAQLVIQAGELGRGGEIFVLDMGEPVRLMDLARDMIHLSGLREGEDIEIKITGLRPGEKLYEELYGDDEQHEPTEHAKIMVAAGAARNLLEVIADVNRLTTAANESESTVRTMLTEIVPPHGDSQHAALAKAA